MKKTAFLTTIYPIDENYVFDFFNSLLRQTSDDFDLIVVNDGFIGLNKFKDKYKNINIIELTSTKNIAKNRELLIRYAIDNQYKYAVFGDVDDYFEENRLEKVQSLLLNNDVVVNDLTTFSNDKIINKKIFTSRILNPANIPLEFILDKNIFGLSNTSIRLDGLRSEDIVFDEKLIAVDWYFFTCLLLCGRNAIFTDKTVTYYRQHNSNTAGIGVINKGALIKAIQIKLVHYNCMKDKNDIFQSLLMEANDLKDVINDESKLCDLISINKENLRDPLWWEIIGFED